VFRKTLESNQTWQGQKKHIKKRSLKWEGKKSDVFERITGATFQKMADDRLSTGNKN